MVNKAEATALPGVVIKTVHEVACTPLMLILARATLELAENGYDGGTTPFSWNSSAIYAECDGKIVGVLAWKRIDWQKQLWIEVGYVLPDYRRRGIYRKMFERLVEKAKALSVRSIAGGVDPDNLAMRHVADSLGRKATSITYEYELPVKDEAS